MKKDTRSWRLGTAGSLILLAAAALEARADDFSGTCTGTIPAAGGPHRLVGTCTVPAGQMLTIETGAVLEGQGNRFDIDGALSATGVTFTDTFFDVGSGGSLALDQSDLTGGDVDFFTGSSGSVTDNAFASTSTCAVFADDTSPAVTGNTFTGGGRVICVTGDSLASPAQPLVDDNIVEANSSSGGIDIDGTAQPTITNNTITVLTGVGIRMDDSSAGTVNANTINFGADVSSNRTGILLRENSQPAVQNNTINDDVFRADFGLSVQVSGASSVQVTGNTIACSGDDHPLQVGPGVFADSFPGDISGNMFGCDLSSVLIQLSGTLTGDTTLGSLEGQSAFELNGNLTVPAGLILSIPPGLSLDGLNRTITVNGGLTTTQATFVNVFFAVNSGGSLGMDQGDVSGAWIDYRVNTTGSVTDSAFQGSNSCSIFVTDASPAITGNTFTGVPRAVCVGGSALATPAQPLIDDNTMATSSTSGGVDVNGTSRPTITNNTITVETGIGVRLEDSSGGTVSGNTIGFAPDVTSNRTAISLNENTAPTVQNNMIGDDVFRPDTGIAVFVSAASSAQVTTNQVTCSPDDTPLQVGPGVFADAFPGDVSGNTFTCDLSTVSIQLSGTLSGDTTLQPLQGQSAFELSGNVSIPAGFDLLVPAGITIDGQGRTFVVNGTMDVADTAMTNAFFQVNGGGEFTADQASFTGGWFDYRAGSSGSVTDNTFQSSNSCSIFVTDASPTITGNDFQGVPRAVCVGGSSLAPPAQPLLDNNTAATASSSGGFDIDGTARPTITNNQITVGSGIGITFGGSSSGTVATNTIDFAPDLASSRTGIQLNNNSAPTVQGNTIGDDPFQSDFGLAVFVSAVSPVQVTGNNVACSGGDHPLQVGPGVFADDFPGDVSGNVFGCDLSSVLIQLSGTLTGNTTLAALEGQTAFELSGNLTVPSGLTLSIPAGISLNGVNRSIVVNGVLSASEASFAGTFFQINGGGSATADLAGFTGGRFDYRAGSSGAVTDSDFEASSSCSIFVTDASPTITGNEFVNVPRAVCVGGSSQSPPAQPLIQNNTASTASSSGGFDVDGTAQPTISGNAIEVRSGGAMSFRGSGAGVASGNTIAFAPNVTSNRFGVEASGNASPTIDGNLIDDDPFRSDVGLLITISEASSAQIIDNSICATGGDVPIRFGPEVFADGAMSTITGNALICGPGVGFQLSGTVSTDSTLQGQAGFSRFQLNSTLTVANGARLGIDPGIEIDGQNNSLRVNGELQVDGANLDNVFFDFRAGSSGTIQNSTLAGPTFSRAVTITDASPSLTGNVFQGMSIAIDLNGTTDATITGNLFQNNGTAVEVSGPTALSTVANNTFMDNTLALDMTSADALFSAFPTDFTTNSFGGGPGSNLVDLPGSLNVSGTLPASPVPYRNTADLRIRDGAQVVIQAGTVIASQGFDQLIVEADSRLVVLGSAEFPVVFTDFTPKDGTRWDGLVVRNSDSILQNCIIEFSRTDGLLIEDASIPITDCRISDNAGDGIDFRGAASAQVSGSAIVMNIGDGAHVEVSEVPAPANPLAIEGNTIFSNGALGVDNRSVVDASVPVFMIPATQNYWGDDSGPNDSSDDRGAGGLFNPTGQGQAVSDGVSYDPWIRIGPTQEGTLTAISGDGQTGTVGTTLPTPLEVEVLSVLGTPLEGIEVIFSVVQGDASIVEAQPVQTGANGRAAASLQLGLTPGAVVVAVTARDVNSPLASFMAEADAPCLMAMTVMPLRLGIEQGTGGQAGDLNGDGFVNNQDAVLLEALLDGSIDESDLDNPDAADVNGDGLVDSGDVLALQGVQVGLVS